MGASTRFLAKKNSWENRFCGVRFSEACWLMVILAVASSSALLSVSQDSRSVRLYMWFIALKSAAIFT